jgi:hypothetical protein
MDDYIYIFLHIPRTGGTTLKWHIERNFSDEERLSLYTDTLNILNNKKICYKPSDYRTLVNLHISKIPKVRLKNIKIIYGHYSIYGLHNHFNKKARYITFLRKPEERIVSYYNYLLQEYYKEQYEGKKQSKYKYGLLIDSEPASLNNWILKLIQGDNYMSLWINTEKILYKLGYLNGMSESEETLINCLKNFYFIGLTELYNIDSLIIYNLLNINKFYKRKNVSIKYAREQEIDKRNEDYKALYKRSKIIFDLAASLSRKYKKINQKSVSDVDIIRLKRKLLLPVTHNFDTFTSKTKALLSRVRSGK